MNRIISNRKYLADIYNETMEIVNRGFYQSSAGETVYLDDDCKMRENSRMYCRCFTVNEIPCQDSPTEISVVNSDSINAGLDAKRRGFNPGILNFANRHNAGGGVLNGARAQEETIFRRTNLFRSLYQFMPNAQSFGVPKSTFQYPMDKNFGGIYSPDITVLRAFDYSFLDVPEKVSFVSVAAMNRPQLINDRIAPELIAGTLNKMRTILRIGLRHGHDAIILGAFGCGAFQNPPQHIAELFREVINENEFRNKYKKIVFAIIEDHNSANGNLQAFKDVFA